MGWKRSVRRAVALAAIGAWAVCAAGAEQSSGSIPEKPADPRYEYRLEPNWIELWGLGAIAALAVFLATWNGIVLPRLDRRFRRLSAEGMNALLSGRYDQAKKQLLGAQRAAWVFGAKDPRNATICSNLGLLYDFLDERDKAEACYKQALSTAEALLGPHHPDLAKPLQDYAGLLRRMERAADARQCEERAKAILGRFGLPDW